MSSTSTSIVKKLPIVYIVVLQYNNSENTVNCLKSLKELEGNTPIVLVDNASQSDEINNTKKYLSGQGGRNIELILNESNFGYSGGNNIGIKYALKNGAGYVLILNNDTIVEKSFLSKLAVAGESDERIGIIAPVINEDDRIVYGGKIEWLKPELNHNSMPPTSYPEKLRNEAGQLKAKSLYISGAAMLIKKQVFEKIGYLDEKYFLYFEDADFCIRAKKVGFQLKIVPESVIHHAVSSSTKKLGSPLLLRYHYRNGHLFNSRYASTWAKILLPFWSLLIIIKQLLKMIFVPSKREISGQIILGVMDFYLKRFGKIK